MISPENITKRTIPLVNTIRKNNPLAPIVLMTYSRPQYQSLIVILKDTPRQWTRH